MEAIYGNVDYDLSKTSGTVGRHGSTDVSAQLEQTADENNPPSSKVTLKILLAALGVLLLCALVVLCALGVLYHSKGSSYEELREQYSGAVERLSEQEHNASALAEELQSRLAEVQVNYENALKGLNSTKELQSRLTEVQVNYENALKRLDSSKALAEELQSRLAEVQVNYENALKGLNSTKELQSRLTEVQVNYENALKRLDSSKETEGQCEALKVKYRTTHEVISKCSECQKCLLCGEGWMSFGVKCYYFSNDTLNWTMSRDYCAGKGGHLVVITNKAEQDFVTSLITEHHWIGLNDLETEGKWMWVNNQTLTETGVTFWFQHGKEQYEPDNWTKEDPSGENCASLGNKGGNPDKWFDASCSYLKKYICEK